MSNLLKAWSSLVFGGGAGGTEQEPESTAEAPQVPAGGTVLLIDDDQEYLEITADLLRHGGFTVLVANSGAKGLNMIRYAQTDLRLVLLDYTMPQLDGEQTLAYLRKLNPRLRVVGVTGSASNEIPAGYRNNLDALIFKPVDSEELLAALAAVLQEPSRQVAGMAPAA